MTDPEQTTHEDSSVILPLLEAASRKATDVSTRVTLYIRRNPMKCLLGAAVIGYLIGCVARRK